VGGLVLGVGFYVLALGLVVRGTARQARQRCERLRQRLPAAVDLMALMLEAGAGTLGECLEKAATENADHPLGEEFRRVLVQVDQGTAQVDALRQMGRRLNDGDVDQLVFALTTAEERGIPLRASLRNLATQMRLRQIQWQEKAAEEARVHITWPGLIVMAACLLIIAAPIIFSLFNGE
jgi:tight adherence protein C